MQMRANPLHGVVVSPLCKHIVDRYENWQF